MSSKHLFLFAFSLFSILPLALADEEVLEGTVSAKIPTVSLSEISKKIPASSIWLVLPKAVGAIRKNTTVAQLKRAYGPQNVEQAKCDAGDDDTEPCIKIQKDGVQIATIYDDDKGRTVVIDKSSDWHTVDGVHLGMAVDDLEKINHAPISIYHFDLNFKAEVKSWNNGAIQAKWGEALRVRLSPKDDYSAKKSDAVNQELKKELLEAKEDDAAFSITNTSVKKLDLKIFEIAVTLQK